MNELQKKWLVALRSGVYKQTRGQMRGASGYCCLGVANECLDLGEPWSEKYLRINYRKLGLRSFDGELVKEVYYKGEICRSLAVLNDRGMSFFEIADLIESDPTNVFVE